jgi:tetratricopeptide (TPR) repeat protein
MRKFLLILCAFFLVGSLMAVPTLKIIKTHDYSYVNRIVIVFSSPVTYQIVDNSADNSLQIKINNAAKAESYIEPVLQNSKTVNSILVDIRKSGLDVNIKTGMPYRREVMNLNEDGYKIVLDIFPKNPPATYEAGLSVADFYFSTHQFNKAKPLFSKIEANYPDKKEINYYIGKNLLGMKRYNEAISKLEKVPATAREAQFSQILINKLKALGSYSDFSQDFLDSNFDSALTEPVVAQAKPAEQPGEQPKVTFQTVTQPKHSTGSILSVIKVAQIPLWFALMLIFILFISSFIMLHKPRTSFRREKSNNVYRDAPKQPTIFVDEDSKRRMISKLLHDGWSNREIAKELHISESEVEHAVKQLSVSDFS